MTNWSLAIHGPWRGPSRGERWVHDGPEGTVHGRRVIVEGVPTIVGATLAGPGNREDGTAVAELLSAPAVAARAAAAAAAAAEAAKTATAGAGLLALRARLQGLPPNAQADLTVREVRAIVRLALGGDA